MCVSLEKLQLLARALESIKQSVELRARQWTLLPTPNRDGAAFDEERWYGAAQLGWSPELAQSFCSLGAVLLEIQRHATDGRSTGSGDALDDFGNVLSLVPAGRSLDALMPLGAGALPGAAYDAEAAGAAAAPRAAGGHAAPAQSSST